MKAVKSKYGCQRHLLGLLLGMLSAGSLMAGPLLAQQPPSVAGEAADRRPQPLRGRVVKGGAPVEGVPVTLHRVTSDGSGPLGEAVTDAQGRFDFVLPPVDTTGFTVFFTTAEFHSVRYFGRAIHPKDALSGYSVEVFDTASTLPEGIRVERRDMVLIPQPDGGWEVDEVVRIHNPSSLTLVSRSGMPTGQIRIPAVADAFQMGESELPADQVRRMEDRVLLLMPLVPGSREIFFRYRIPAAADEAVLALESPADTFNVFVRQPAPRLSVSGLRSTDLVSVQGESFLQYGGTDLPAGASIALEWESSAPPLDPIITGTGAALLLLAVGGWAAFRNRQRQLPSRITSSEPEELTASRAQ